MTHDPEAATKAAKKLQKSCKKAANASRNLQILGFWGWAGLGWAGPGLAWPGLGLLGLAWWGWGRGLGSWGWLGWVGGNQTQGLGDQANRNYTGEPSLT